MSGQTTSRSLLTRSPVGRQEGTSTRTARTCFDAAHRGGNGASSSASGSFPAIKIQCWHGPGTAYNHTVTFFDGHHYATRESVVTCAGATRHELIELTMRLDIAQNETGQNETGRNETGQNETERLRSARTSFICSGRAGELPAERERRGITR